MMADNEMRPIRILHVIGHMDRGGAENMIMNLYRQMDSKIIQFDFVEHYDREAAFDTEILKRGGRIFHCPVYRPQHHIAYVQWWNDFFRTHGSEYRVVHGHIGSTAAIYLSIAKKYGCTTIAHSHNAIKGSIAHRFYYYPTRYIADYFFGCGLEALKSRYGKKVLKSNRWKVIRNGIDLERFSFSLEARNDIRDRYKIHRDATVIGHVGRFMAVKNHMFLLDVFHHYLYKNPNSYLMLIGDGELREEIEIKAHKMGLKNHIVFAGVQSDTAPFYSAMDLFIFPSIGEGLPLALVEAQTSSLPCLISNTIPAESELIQELVHWKALNDSAKSWADEADGCIGALQRVDRIQDMSKTGYAIEQIADELKDIYIYMQLGQKVRL